MNVYKSGLSDNNSRVLITLFIPVRAKTNLYRKNIIKRLKEAKLTSPNFQPRLFVKSLESIYQKLI